MAGTRPDEQGLPPKPQPSIRDLQGVGDAERGGALNTDTGLDEVGARQGITRTGTSPGGGSTGVDSAGGGGSLGAAGGNLMSGGASGGAIGTASGGNLGKADDPDAAAAGGGSRTAGQATGAAGGTAGPTGITSGPTGGGITPGTSEELTRGTAGDLTGNLGERRTGDRTDPAGRGGGSDASR